MIAEDKDKAGDTTAHKIPGTDSNEKTSAGGRFNSGVTSNDAGTKEKIEKKATLLDEQPPSDNEEKEREDPG